MKKTLSNYKSLTASFLTLIAYIVYTLPLKVSAFEVHIKSHLNASTFEGLILDVLHVLIIIATPIIVLYIIYAGFMYVTARGNVQQTQQATRALMYAIIGGVLILGAVALAEIIENVVESFT